MSNRSRTAETLEADAIEDAKLLGEAVVRGFKPSASIKRFDKNEFIKELARVWYGGDRDAAHETFIRGTVFGAFDPLRNEAFYTLRECVPSYKGALEAAVHEAYGHGYINEMRAVREGHELKNKMLRGEASELETAKAILADMAFQVADEGFAHWVSAKADGKVKSDRKHFAKYDQTRLDAWALLEYERPKIHRPSKKAFDDQMAYAVVAELGHAIYREIEKKFGERAVLSAAKACLDVPLDEIVGDEMAELRIASKGTPAPGAADALCWDYVRKRLKAISGYSGPYSSEADFEKKARELANSCKKPAPGDADIGDN